MDEEFSLAPPKDLPDRLDEVRCVKKFNEGVDVDDGDLRRSQYPNVMKNFSCKLPVKVPDQEDKIAYVGLPVEDKLGKNVWLNLYLSSVETLTPKQVSQRNGVFTWIFYRKKGSDDIQFAASQVRSAFELGTAHGSIAMNVGAYTIHGAGEMKKTGNNILYNYLSGTYVLSWIGKKDKSCTLPEMENLLDPKFKALFPGFVVNRFAIGQTLITPSELPASMEELQLYADARFIVCIHDKDDIETCKKGPNGCVNMLRPRV